MRRAHREDATVELPGQTLAANSLKSSASVPRVCIKIAVHLRLPFLTPSCDANSRFPHAYPRVAMLKAPIRFSFWIDAYGGVGSAEYGVCCLT